MTFIVQRIADGLLVEGVPAVAFELVDDPRPAQRRRRARVIADIRKLVREVVDAPEPKVEHERTERGLTTYISWSTRRRGSETLRLVERIRSSFEEQLVEQARADLELVASSRREAAELHERVVRQVAANWKPCAESLVAAARADTPPVPYRQRGVRVRVRRGRV